MYVQVSLKLDVEATASITQMEHEIQQAGQQAMREAFKQAIRQREEQQGRCPFCGQQQYRLEGTVRRVISTIFGRVQVPRRRFRCQSCDRRWCPANELFAELKGATMSTPLQEVAILAGSSWPYRVASTLLKRLCGAQISAEEIRLLTNQYGKQRATFQQEEAEQRCQISVQQEPAGQRTSEPMLVGMDGGWVWSREQRGGMEGKVAVVCSQMQDLPRASVSHPLSWKQWLAPPPVPRQRHRLSQRRYVATFGSSKQIGAQTKAAANLLGQGVSRPVVLVADGAEWIKQEQARHFAQATCILDWSHLWRQVGHAIRAVARAKPLPEQERDYQLHLQRARLWLGNVPLALQGLQALESGLPTEALQTLRGAITYVEHQRAWIGSYEHWREQGYPVGSGMIERAVSLVINRRMKKRGMRWCRPNATALVALRTDLLNNDWVTPQRLRAFP